MRNEANKAHRVLTRVLLTRPRAASERFAAALRRAVPGVELVVSPVIEIEHLSPEISYDGLDGLVFTSAHGVSAVPENTGLPAFCVGDRTAQAATERGMIARSAGGAVEDLIAMIKRAGAKNLLYLRGQDVAREIDGIASIIVYRQCDTALSEAAKAWLGGGAAVVLPLFSARSAAQFVRQLTPYMNAPLYIICISQAVADACAEVSAERVLVARRPDAEAMIEAIASVTGR